MADRTRVPTNHDGPEESAVRTDASKTYWTPERVLHKAYLDWMKASRDGGLHDSNVRHIGEFAVKRLQKAGYTVGEASDG